MARRMKMTIAAALLLSLGACQDRPAVADRFAQVTIAGRPFNLEIAADHDARLKGLSDRESIAADGGMLFVFPSAKVRQFVMRRCLVPIDIIFLGPGGRVAAMHAMQVEPYNTPEDRLRRYSSGWPAQFAIELAGGTLQELDLHKGDKVDLPLDELKARAR